MIFDKSKDAFHFLLFPIQVVVYASAITLVAVGNCVEKVWNRKLSEDN